MLVLDYLKKKICRKKTVENWLNLDDWKSKLNGNWIMFCFSKLSASTSPFMQVGAQPMRRRGNGRLSVRCDFIGSSTNLVSCISLGCSCANLDLDCQRNFRNNKQLFYVTIETKCRLMLQTFWKEVFVQSALWKGVKWDFNKSKN